MDVFDAIEGRKTSTARFLPDPPSMEHQRRLMHLASRATSLMNSQPWRYVLIDDREVIGEIARIDCEAYQRLTADGEIVRRLGPWMRFSRDEEGDGDTNYYYDGVLVNLPRGLDKAIVRRFLSRYFMAGITQRVLNWSGFYGRMAKKQRSLVSSTPLVLAVLLDRNLILPVNNSRMYAIFSAGCSMENVWLGAGALGIGIDPINGAIEDPGARGQVEELLRVPDHMEILLLFRVGYLLEEGEGSKDASTDHGWRSGYRRPISQYVCRNTCECPERDDEAMESGGSPNE